MVTTKEICEARWDESKLVHKEYGKKELIGKRCPLWADKAFKGCPSCMSRRARGVKAARIEIRLWLTRELWRGEKPLD